MPPKKKTTPKKKVSASTKKVVPLAEPMPIAAAEEPAAPIAAAPTPAEPTVACARERPAEPVTCTVKYTVTTTVVEATPDGVLSMEAIDEELAISFAFPGAFVARLRRGDAVIPGEGAGLATVFRNVTPGEYVLEVDEDAEHAIEAVAYRAAAPEEDVSRRTAAAHAVTAELRGLAADELQGAKYAALLEARDVEDVLFGSG